ncbi:lysozyme [Hymenobacter sp. APR13]|uniref:lysozyme n=1 Tax=Hymenobacter sp. APR13 TaxID=1356852 RepID=UPI0005C76464|nr:lysozyme [Hymenobacter sp. APR13]
MKVDKVGRDFLIREEGVVLKAYKCAAGVWTIGAGSTGRHVKPGVKITMQQAEALLTHDLKRFEEAVATLVTVELTQNQTNALVSLAFNIGINGFAKSSLLREINAGNKDDVERITECFCMWRNAGGKPILLKRRQRESALFYK